MSGSVAFISGNLLQISTILSSISTQNELNSRLQELSNLVNQAISLLDSINCPSLASLLRVLLNNILMVLNYLIITNDLTVVSGTSTIATILLSISINLNSILIVVCQGDGNTGATGVTGKCSPNFILSNLQTIANAITTNNFSSQDAINNTVANVIGPALFAISRCFQIGPSPGPVPGPIPGVTGSAIVINIPVNNTNNNNITDRNSQGQVQQQPLYDFYRTFFNRCKCKRGYCGYKKCRKWWGRRPWWC